MQRTLTDGSRASRLWRGLFVFGIAALIAGELFFRFAHYELLKTRAFPQIYAPDPVLGWRYVPGAEGALCIPSICKRFRINQRGYVGRNFEIEKPEGTYRIAIAGVSVANGIWLDGDETYGQKLERMLIDRGYPVEIINIAVDGYARDVETIRIVEREVPRFDADLVILSVEPDLWTSDMQRAVYRDYVIVYAGRSDPASRQQVEKQVDLLLDLLRPLTLIYDLSFIVRATVRFYLQRLDPDESKLANVLLVGYIERKIGFGSTFPEPELTEHALPDLHDFLRARSTKLVLLDFDETRERHPSRAGILSVAMGISRDDPRFQHEFDGHPNELAHDIVAQKLFKALTQQPWFPAPRPGSQ